MGREQMYTRLKSFIQHLLRPYKYYQVLLVVNDVCGSEIFQFQFSIDQVKTTDDLGRLARISWKSLGETSTFFTAFLVVKIIKSKDDLRGQMPSIWGALREELGNPTIHPIIDIDITD